jgi:hypothetical protein
MTTDEPLKQETYLSMPDSRTEAFTLVRGRFGFPRIRTTIRMFQNLPRPASPLTAEIASSSPASTPVPKP